MSEQYADEGIQLTLDPKGTDTRAEMLGTIPKMGTIVSHEESDYSAGTIDEIMLSESEKETVDQFVKEIDIANVDQIVMYGASAQKNISDFSVSVLKKVKTLDLGEIGTALKELTVALDATVEPEKKGIAGIFQKAKRGVDSIRANYAKAEANVDRVEKDLEAHVRVLTQDISMYQQMYELNTKYYKELTMYVIAGKKALDISRKGKLAELCARAEKTQKQEDAQEYKDFLDQCCIYISANYTYGQVTCVVGAQIIKQICHDYGYKTRVFFPDAQNYNKARLYSENCVFNGHVMIGVMINGQWLDMFDAQGHR